MLPLITDIPKKKPGKWSHSPLPQQQQNTTKNIGIELTKKVKDLYKEKFKILVRATKKTLGYGKTSDAHGLEE